MDDVLHDDSMTFVVLDDQNLITDRMKVDGDLVASVTWTVEERGSVDVWSLRWTSPWLMEFMLADGVHAG